ncbi:GTP pyrophosphokinase [Hyphococcus luteus]|uniref:RelA/SpoT domain-containing protein n=1 Tax=Hyphococcus luteus TaxID=2058213 RepID=A0A2S7K2F1_9PROT|nr:RelA/SpoT domain-containing protein [Marinicaulis flavus]PQA86676.1 hypothetical protein CW354_14360 [Marinicaulis flavus]
MMSLREQYEDRYANNLVPAANALEAVINNYLKPFVRVDRVSARAKSVDRFIKKSNKLEGKKKKYTDPLNQIQDQIGARIITYYLSDVKRIEEKILPYFQPIEEKAVVPESNWEFGYFGKHFIMALPNEIIYSASDRDNLPEFFELQIKTLFQHAWAEAEHDLAYKPELGELDGGEMRKLAFTAAQAWGADEIFNELFLKKAAEGEK